jgi:hypothetical protein
MTDFTAEQFQDISQVTSFLQQLYHIKINYSIVLTIIYKETKLFPLNNICNGIKCNKFVY